MVPRPNAYGVANLWGSDDYATNRSTLPSTICSGSWYRIAAWVGRTTPGPRQAQVKTQPLNCSCGPDTWDHVIHSSSRSDPQVCKKLGVSEQTYYRWRKEYGGLRLDQAKRLKALEQENTQLKKLVADQALDNMILKEVASGNF